MEKDEKANILFAQVANAIGSKWATRVSELEDGKIGSFSIPAWKKYNKGKVRILILLLD